MAEEYHRPPAELLQIDDPYTAWCVNEVVFFYRRRVMHAIQERLKSVPSGSRGDNSHKEAVSHQMLQQFLDYDPTKADDEQPETERKGRFRDPVATVRR